MASLVGQSFPEDVTFTYIPYIPDKGGLNQVCGMPVAYKASDEFKDKKVVIVAVPGAFTPTCSEQHLPTFLEQKAAFQQAGVDKIIVLASNDPFVMSAWGKANGVTDDYIVSFFCRLILFVWLAMLCVFYCLFFTATKMMTDHVLLLSLFRVLSCSCL